MATTNQRRMAMKIKSIVVCAAALLSPLAWSSEAVTAGNYAEVETRYNGEWTYPQSQLASNIYSQVKYLYSDYRSPYDYFVTVRGGGFCREMDYRKILPLATLVSNNCAALVADWQTYEQNEMVRFTTLCAIAYSGFSNYTNFVDRVLARYEADTNSCSWATIRFASFPRGTILENGLEMNYDKPGVSNILVRLRALAVARGDNVLRDACDRELSGEAKRETLDLQAAGAL